MQDVTVRPVPSVFRPASRKTTVPVRPPASPPNRSESQPTRHSARHSQSHPPTHPPPHACPAPPGCRFGSPGMGRWHMGSYEHGPSRVSEKPLPSPFHERGHANEGQLFDQTLRRASTARVLWWIGRRSTVDPVHDEGGGDQPCRDQAPDPPPLARELDGKHMGRKRPGNEVVADDQGTEGDRGPRGLGEGRDGRGVGVLPRKPQPLGLASSVAFVKQ